jgi:hypothetical protein
VAYEEEENGYAFERHSGFAQDEALVVLRMAVGRTLLSRNKDNKQEY